MHTIKLLLTYYLNISLQAANLSDCRIESKKIDSIARIESNRNFFCPNWKALACIWRVVGRFCCRTRPAAGQAPVRLRRQVPVGARRHLRARRQTDQHRGVTGGRRQRRRRRRRVRAAAQQLPPAAARLPHRPADRRRRRRRRRGCRGRRPQSRQGRQSAKVAEPAAGSQVDPVEAGERPSVEQESWRRQEMIDSMFICHT